MKEIADRTVEFVRNKIERKKIDLLILSDYGKGLLSFRTTRLLIEIAKKTNVPIIIDPKLLPDYTYKYTTVLKMNRKYFETVRKYKCADNEIITDGKHGLFGWINGAKFSIPSISGPRAKYVVGAGDCFLAHLALAWARGMRNVKAVEYADRAARVYCQLGFGEPVLPHEAEGRKILSINELVKTLKLRHRNQKIIASNGCFDLLHPGHIHTLRWAKAQGDVLVVPINDDASVQRLKGPGRPEIPLEQRAESVAALDCVDYVVPFFDTDHSSIMKKIEPDIIVKGSDNLPQNNDDGFEMVIAEPSGFELHSSDLLKV